MNISQGIADRVKGHIPISIASSLAIESLSGTGEFTGERVKLLKFNSVWISINTVYRNLVGSIDKQYLKSLSPSLLLDFISEELSIIETALKKVKPSLKIVFYYRDYTQLAKQFPLAKLKTPRTDKQFIAMELEQLTLKQFLNQDFLHHNLDIRKTNRLEDKTANSLILTHHSVDLLDYKQFGKLELIESHTGSLKKPLEWNTKLTKIEGIDRLPFNRLTIQVLGDKSTDFLSYGIKEKRALMDIAKKGRWRPNTTRDKIHHTFQKYSGLEYVDLFKRMLK